MRVLTGASIFVVFVVAPFALMGIGAVAYDDAGSEAGRALGMMAIGAGLLWLGLGFHYTSNSRWRD